MVVFRMVHKVWIFPQHMLCALLNVQVIASRLQEILCWALLLGAPMLILCALLVLRCLLFGSSALFALGEGMLAIMFLLVSLESFSLLLLVRFSPLQEDMESGICQKESTSLSVDVRKRKPVSLVVQQELARKQALSRSQRRLSQVLSPLARQIASADDLGRVEQKTSPDKHCTRSIPIERIPTVLLHLPKSSYPSPLRESKSRSGTRHL